MILQQRKVIGVGYLLKQPGILEEILGTVTGDIYIGWWHIGKVSLGIQQKVPVPE